MKMIHSLKSSYKEPQDQTVLASKVFQRFKRSIIPILNDLFQKQRNKYFSLILKGQLNSDTKSDENITRKLS